MTKDWHQRDASIKSRANADPRQHQLENREINIPQEHDQAGKEQEQGNVEKRGQCLDCPWEEKLLNSFGEEGTDSSSLVWTVTQVSDLEISSCPLLQQRREQSAGKANHQAQEPKCIHPDRIGWWREWGWGSREGTRNVRSIRVSKSLIDVREVEIGGVLWVLLDILNRY